MSLNVRDNNTLAIAIFKAADRNRGRLYVHYFIRHESQKQNYCSLNCKLSVIQYCFNCGFSRGRETLVMQTGN